MDENERFLQTSELDIAIVDALNVNPRSPWARVAAAVGVDAGTVARRWRRLEEAGLAWAICVRGTHILDNVHDHIDMRCQPGNASRVAAMLGEDSRCVSVSTVTGGAEVRVLIDVPDLVTLDAFMATPLWQDRDIHSVEHNIALAMYRNARGWTSGGHLGEPARGAPARHRRAAWQAAAAGRRRPRAGAPAAGGRTHAGRNPCPAPGRHRAPAASTEGARR